MAISPAQLAASGTEEGHQAAFFCQLALDIHLSAQSDHPFNWVHHIPNGGSRGDTKLTAAKQGALMKKIGVKKGVLDIFWPYPKDNYHGFYLEFKSPTGDGEISKEQLAFIIHAHTQGYYVAVVDTWEEGIRAIHSYYRGEYIFTDKYGHLLDAKDYVGKAYRRYNK